VIVTAIPNALDPRIKKIEKAHNTFPVFVAICVRNFSLMIYPPEYVIAFDIRDSHDSEEGACDLDRISMG
jgi:hypothetical protein